MHSEQETESPARCGLLIRDAMIRDLPKMLEIYNHVVRTSAATFDLEDQTLEQRSRWFFGHGEKKYPLIVGEINGDVVGYCSLSRFRDKPAYASTVESSVYVASEFQGRGIGTLLMREIIRRAIELGYHTIIAGIAAGNESSVKLHTSLGFQYIGSFKEVGFKFGKWQDVLFYQLHL